MPRSLLAGLVAVVAAIMPAAAWAQDGPTLTFDQPCYSPGDTMTFSGAGYTPGGAVNMFVNSFTTQQTGSFDTVADAAGAIAGEVNTPDPDEYLSDNDWAGEMGVAANDQTRVDAGGGPPEAVGSTSFTLSRFEVAAEQPNGRPAKAGKRLRITAVGYTNGRGKVLYAHYRRNRRTLKTLKLGRLGGDCGDRTRTLPRALPRGLPRGRYELVFNTSRRDPQAMPKQSLKLKLR
jgi:hypothetical protein